MSQLSISKHIITIFTLFQLLGFVVVPQGITEEQNTTLSGRITNLQGEPIPDATVILLYFKFNIQQTIHPIYDHKLYPFLVDLPHFFNPGIFPDKQDKNSPPPYIESITDAEGKFSFSNIASELVQLMVLSTNSLENDTTPDESGRKNRIILPIIHSVQIDEVTFFPQQNKRFPPTGAVTFAIKPGRNIENVELKVSMENPLNLRGRILYKDGTPLSDTSLTIKIGQLNFYYANQFPYRIPVSIKTDENGFFEHKLYTAGIYACSIIHRGLSAISAPFILNGVTPHEVIVLTLNGNPDDIDNLKSKDTNKEQTTSYRVPSLTGVWIINPENGHVYKRIVCKSREDAQIQASKEDAHLVTITNEKEQIWLESVFGTNAYWIGLTGHRNSDNWIWDTGERIKYKNWIKDNHHRPPPAIFKLFRSRNDKPRRDNLDYAIMTQDEETGYMKWQIVNHRHSDRGYTRIAVIEKDSMPSKREVTEK